jgi:heat-inducible transcriptional repressor
VPTESGYRLYADRLLARQESRPAEFPLALASARAEVDDALQATTEMLSQVTRLLALVSAPPLQAATVRHVDVLQLQARVVMVVVITSTGGVSKQRTEFAEPVDPGLVGWAGEYLRERLTGARLRSRLIANAFDEPGLSQRERAFLAVLRPAFDQV